MKLSSIIKCSLGTAVVFSLFISCEKFKPVLVGGTDFNLNNKAQIQVLNATLNSAKTYVYIDYAPVTGAAMSYGSMFPSGGPGYIAVLAGYKAILIRDTSAVSTQKALSFAESLQATGNYTIFMYDTLTLAKKKTVLNEIIVPGDTTSRVRLANFIYSATAVPAIDVFSVKRNTTIFTNLQTTDVSGFIPYASNVNDTLLVRETGTTNLLYQLNGFFPTQKKSYTLLFRGRYQTTGTTGVARTLAAYNNN